MGYSKHESPKAIPGALKITLLPSLHPRSPSSMSILPSFINCRISERTRQLSEHHIPPRNVNIFARRLHYRGKYLQDFSFLRFPVSRFLRGFLFLRSARGLLAHRGEVLLKNLVG